MSIVPPCICEKASPDPSTHEHDCPVRRAWERGGGGEKCAECGVHGGHEANCATGRAVEREAQAFMDTLRSGPSCACGLGSTKPAYRHGRGCPVYRAWLQRPRAAGVDAGPVIGDGVPLFTVGQVCVTRDGRRARVLAVDLAGEQPVAAAVMRSDGTETVETYTALGGYSDSSRACDLLPAPRRAVVWVRGRWDAGGKYDCWLGDKRLGKPDGNSAATFEIRVELEEGRFDD